MSEPTEEKITETLRRAYSREQAHGREPVYFRTPLEDLMSREEGEDTDEYSIKREAFDRMLDYFFADGPHPGTVMRRVFAWAKALRSELLLNMSLDEIGKMFGEGRAAQSWRIKQLVTRPLKASGAKGSHLPWQKSPTAVEKYSASAIGNRNRRGGKKLKKYES